MEQLSSGFVYNLNQFLTAVSNNSDLLEIPLFVVISLQNLIPFNDHITGYFHVNF